MLEVSEHDLAEELLDEFELLGLLTNPLNFFEEFGHEVKRLLA